MPLQLRNQQTAGRWLAEKMQSRRQGQQAGGGQPLRDFVRRPLKPPNRSGPVSLRDPENQHLPVNRKTVKHGLKRHGKQSSRMQLRMQLKLTSPPNLAEAILYPQVTQMFRKTVNAGTRPTVLRRGPDSRGL
jgi:hypothetical protein